jgi:hypothetical protein
MARILAFFALVLCAFAGDDPFLGTWKCNFEKSGTTVANPPARPVSMTLRYVADGAGFRITGEALMSDGQKRASERTVVYDGEEHPRTPDSPADDVVINRRIDRNTEEIVYKRAGKITTTITRVISQNGKALTYTSKSISDSGAPNETVIVYEKQ